MRSRIVLPIALLVVACTHREAPAQQPTPHDTLASALVPSGHGTLSQDAITLAFRVGTLDIRFTPLDERVTRLLANDAAQSLTRLLAVHQAWVDSAAARHGVRTPGIAMVSFFGLAPDTRFDPRLLSLNSRNRLTRPVTVLPLSPTFSAQQLGVRDVAMGLFLFEEPIPVTEPFAIEYLGTTAGDWERRLSRFDRERARIQSRSGGGTPEGNP